MDHLDASAIKRSLRDWEIWIKLLRRLLRPHLRPKPLPALLIPPRPNPRCSHFRRLRPRHSHYRVPFRQTPAPLCIRPIRLSIDFCWLCHPPLPRTRPRRRQIRRPLPRHSRALCFPLAAVVHDGE